MSKYSKDQIDKMTWPEARAAAKAELGIKGSWVSDCTLPRMKAMLKGEMTPADAEAAVLADKATKRGITIGGGGVDATALKPLEEKITALAASQAVLDADTKKLIGELDSETKRLLGETSDAFTKLQDAVTSALAAGPKAAAAIAPILGVSATSSTDPVLATLERYCAPGRAIKPVIVRGEPGSGKTYGARLHGQTAGFDRYIEFGIHEQTEASEFLGNLSPDPAIGWMDGPLTEAFRAAASGLTVMLCLEKFYRAMGGARTPLLTSTSPARLPSGEKVNRLRTGRAILDPATGAYVSEVIEAPVRNLAIVATTNVGAQFNVDLGCPAERERFVSVHVDVDIAKLRSVCAAIATAKGFSNAVVEKCVKFYQHCNVLKKDGFVELCPSIRLLSEAIEFADSEANVKTSVRDIGINVWAGMGIEGKPEVEQIKRIDDALNKAFGS